MWPAASSVLSRVQATPLEERFEESGTLLEISAISRYANEASIRDAASRRFTSASIDTVDASASRTTIEEHASIRFLSSIRCCRNVRIVSPGLQVRS